jgi:hypothetical protein
MITCCMKRWIFLWLMVCIFSLAHAQEERDYLQEGIRQYEVTHYAKAVSILNLEIRTNPSGEVYYYRAQARYHLKDYQGALEDFIPLAPIEIGARKGNAIEYV